jgi:DNA-binding transcriptional ArsR family regulator
MPGLRRALVQVPRPAGLAVRVTAAVRRVLVRATAVVGVMAALVMVVRPGGRVVLGHVVSASRRGAAGRPPPGQRAVRSLYYVHMSARMHLSGAHEAQQPDDGTRLAVAAEVLGLLADRTRLALLQRLARGEADVTTLTRTCGAARPAVSQHLARLRLAGLVTARKQGRRVIYALGHGHLRRLVEEALSVADHRIGRLSPHD